MNKYKMHYQNGLTKDINSIKDLSELVSVIRNYNLVCSIGMNHNDQVRKLELLTNPGSYLFIDWDDDGYLQ